MHPGEELSVGAWGELCMSTVPELQACVLRAMGECPGEPLVVDLRRVWFCDLAGLRALWRLVEQGSAAGTEVALRESESIVRMARLVDDVRVARIA